VHLLCQEREAGRLDWVDRVGRWEAGRLEIAGGAVGEGTVTVYLPEIGEVLPVYVEDRYEGFRAVAFPSLTDAELERYLNANVAAVREVAERAGGIDAALANHLVMGPAILARSGLPFAAKVHGSALSYTVRPHPERFLPYAREGMAAARAVLVGSRYTAESLWETVGDPTLPGRTRLGPPGVDVDLFSPLPAGREPAAALRALADRVAATVTPVEAGADAFARDAAEGAAALRDLAAASGPRVAFVGKLIVSKGPDLVVAAWPLVAPAHPGARLLLVGFGEYREGLERLLAALDAGDLEEARRVAAQGRRLEGDPTAPPLRLLGDFLARAGDDYARAAAECAGSVSLAGRLEHHEVGRLLPAVDATVVPSTFPEAFGMVAAEAAAAGAFPVCADHSGLREVAGALSGALPAALAPLVAFPLEGDPVGAIAERLDRWLSLPSEVRDPAREALVATVRERWSWAGVARGVLAGAAGRLDDLPSIPEG
jgi:glycosyltransferase involved in cell wall biosynthesis